VTTVTVQEYLASEIDHHQRVRSHLRDLGDVEVQDRVIAALTDVAAHVPQDETSGRGPLIDSGAPDRPPTLAIDALLLRQLVAAVEHHKRAIDPLQDGPPTPGTDMTVRWECTPDCPRCAAAALIPGDPS
jgi:hypothetical protein